MGYLPIIKGNKCYHPSSRKFCIPMDVTFAKKRKLFLEVLSSGEDITFGR